MVPVLAVFTAPVASAVNAVVLLAAGVACGIAGLFPAYVSPAQAAQAGLTISNGVTPAFWIYCAFVVALVMICASMVIPPRPIRPGRAVTPPGSIPSPMPAPAMTAEDSRDLAGAAGRQDGPAA